MVKISLAYLNYSYLLKDIALEHPILIYYICHLENPDRFKSNLFNFEEDCRKLRNKFDITEYIPPRERKTHWVGCRLKSEYKDIVRELIEQGVCENLTRFFQQEDESGDHIYINREKFKELFWERFTFEEDPEKLIENRLNLIKNQNNINLPPNNYIHEKSGNLLIITYLLEDDSFYFVITIKCACTKSTSVKILSVQNHFDNYQPYEIECERCRKIFGIAFNLYFIQYIISPQ